jgi:uncharacterized membrane protein YdcZ (DUF606 family)
MRIGGEGSSSYHQTFSNRRSFPLRGISKQLSGTPLCLFHTWKIRVKTVHFSPLKGTTQVLFLIGGDCGHIIVFLISGICGGDYFI